MTPEARINAAAELLDTMLAGTAPEPALSGWARGHRFAGSKDRAAIRDHVFDALRQRRSLAALGGGATGRGLMLGAVRKAGIDPDTVFTGQGHAPAPLTEAERAGGHLPAPGSAEALDCPDWLWPELARSLGAELAAALTVLQARAPVHLRVNLRRASRADAAAGLADEGIETRPHPLSSAALEITGGARRLRGAASYADGTVELQDAGSQALSDAVPLPAGGRLLDYCAGGGGKTLAIAARVEGRFFAHDAQAGRMRDLPARAARAGVAVQLLSPGTAEAAAPYDTVLCDVPCSGSGSWRRDPAGKWALDRDRLHDLTAVQEAILARAAELVAPGGVLAYATCSLLSCENEDRVAGFRVGRPDWKLLLQKRFSLTEGGDGFFLACLRRG